MMLEISLLTDSTTDLQSCKWIPPGIRYMLGPFLLLSSHALFRHQIRHHIKCQQLPHLQRLPFVFTPSSQPSYPPRVCPRAFSLFLKPFPLCCCLPTALKHLWSFPSLHWKITLCKHFLSMLWYFASTIYLQDDQPCCWRVSGGARGSNHHLLLHNKWACWTSVTILVNANRKKKGTTNKKIKNNLCLDYRRKAISQLDDSKKRLYLLFWIH